MRSDWGSTTFDTRYYTTSYVSYLVPTPHLAPILTREWQFNALITYTSENPINLLAGSNVSGSGENKDRVNLVADPFQNVPVLTGTRAVQYFKSRRLRQAGSRFIRKSGTRCAIRTKIRIGGLFDVQEFSDSARADSRSIPRRDLQFVQPRELGQSECDAHQFLFWPTDADEKREFRAWPWLRRTAKCSIGPEDHLLSLRWTRRTSNAAWSPHGSVAKTGGAGLIG